MGGQPSAAPTSTPLTGWGGFGSRLGLGIFCDLLASGVVGIVGGSFNCVAGLAGVTLGPS